MYRLQFASAIFSAFGLLPTLANATAGAPISGLLHQNQIVVNGATSIKGLSVYQADVKAAGTKTKKITSVVYSLVSYPSQGGVEAVEICYSTPYSTVVGWCQPVAPGSSGVILAFNSLAFGAGAEVWVRHKVTGGTFPAAAPLSSDGVTINWQY